MAGAGADECRMVTQSAAAAAHSVDPVAPANGNANGNGRPEALVESYRRLAEVFHEVLSEQSLDALLERIAVTLGDLMPYEALHIYEADEDRRVLVPLKARSQVYEEEIMRSRPRFGEGITGWAVENRRPVWTNRAHLDPRAVTVPGTPVEPEAMISIPLIARGALKGALNIYRIGEDAEFAEPEFHLARSFGDAAALALDNAQIRARLEHLAQTDSLTSLYNHRYFHERLRAELTRASRSHDTVAVLMFDLDDFKRVNDVYGHGVGRQPAGLPGAAAAGGGGRGGGRGRRPGDGGGRRPATGRRPTPGWTPTAGPGPDAGVRGDGRGHGPDRHPGGKKDKRRQAHAVRPQQRSAAGVGNARDLAPARPGTARTRSTRR